MLNLQNAYKTVSQHNQGAVMIEASHDVALPVARGFAHDLTVFLLDEPTTSLDTAHRDVVLALIEEANVRDTTIIGIFHDDAARARVCDREVNVADLASGIAA